MNNIEKNENLLTISQASKILNVHPDTLRRWEKSGRIESIRIGSRKDRRYRAKDIYQITEIPVEIDDFDIEQNVLDYSKVKLSNELILNAKLVLFDLGDTLMSVYPSRGYVYSEIASKYGFNLKPSIIEDKWHNLYQEWEKERLISDVLLKSDEKEYEYLYSKLNANALHYAGLPSEKSNVALEIGKEIFLSILDNPKYWQILPDVTTFLENLIKMGKKIALVSNWNSSMKAFVEKSPLNIYFSNIYSGTQLQNKKPNPYIFEQAIKDFEINKDEVVHIGNSYIDDIVGAKNASIKAILFDNNRDYLNSEIPAFYQYSDLILKL